MWRCFNCPLDFDSRQKYAAHAQTVHEFYVPENSPNLPCDYSYCIIPENIIQTGIVPDLNEKNGRKEVVFISANILKDLKACSVVATRFLDTFSVNLSPNRGSGQISDNNCQFCGMIFLRNDIEQRIKHLRFCLKRPDKFPCETCGRAFKSKKNLRLHKFRGLCTEMTYEYERNQTDTETTIQKDTGKTNSVLKSKTEGKSCFKFLKHPEKLQTTSMRTPNLKLTAVQKAKSQTMKLSKANIKRTIVKFNLPDETPKRKTKKAEKKEKSMTKVGSSPTDFQLLSLPGFNAFQSAQFSLKDFLVDEDARKEDSWMPVRQSIDQRLIKTEALDLAQLDNPDNNNNNKIPILVTKKGLRCAECGADCLNIQDLEKHVRTAKHSNLDNNIAVVLSPGTDSGKKQLICKICSSVFAVSKMFSAKFHAFLHVYPEAVRQMYSQQTFKCPRRKCTLVFDNARDLEQHDKREHWDVANVKKLRCQYPNCTAVFTTHPGLKDHESDFHKEMVPLVGSLKRDFGDKETALACKKQRLNGGFYLASNAANCCNAFAAFKESEDVCILHDELCLRDRACLLCKEVLPTKTELTGHYRETHRSNSGNGYKCVLCSHNSLTYVAFSKHVRTIHQCFFVADMPEYGITQIVKSDLQNPNQKRFNCENCKMAFGDFSRIRLHKIVADNHTCKICSKRCCSVLDKAKHYKQNHPSEFPKLKGTQPIYLCKACKKSYKSLKKYQCHFALHYTNMNTCCYCSELLHNDEELDSHIQEEHIANLDSQKQSSLKCPQLECELQTSSLIDLKIHMYQKHFKTDPVFVCKNLLCLKVLRSEKQYTAHMSSCSSMCNQSSSPLIPVSSKEKPAAIERNFETSEVPARQITKAPELICLD